MVHICTTASETLCSLGKIAVGSLHAPLPSPLASLPPHAPAPYAPCDQHLVNSSLGVQHVSNHNDNIASSSSSRGVGNGARNEGTEAVVQPVPPEYQQQLLQAKWVVETGSLVLLLLARARWGAWCGCAAWGFVLYINWFSCFIGACALSLVLFLKERWGLAWFGCAACSLDVCVFFSMFILLCACVMSMVLLVRAKWGAWCGCAAWICVLYVNWFLCFIGACALSLVLFLKERWGAWCGCAAWTCVPVQDTNCFSCLFFSLWLCDEYGALLVRAWWGLWFRSATWIVKLHLWWVIFLCACVLSLVLLLVAKAQWGSWLGVLPLSACLELRTSQIVLSMIFFGFCAEPGAAVGSKGTVRIVVWVCCFCLHA